MKLFAEADILEIERQTMAERGMSKLDFIEAVGKDIADEISGHFDKSTPLVIFAGPDTCGAYALSAARRLYESGMKPYVFLFNIGGDRLSTECDICRTLYLKVSEEQIMTEITGLKFSMPELDNGMIVLDGLFGSEISGPLSRGYQMLVSYINDSGATIISIDSPSGLPGDPMSGLINSKIIHADCTLAVMLPRRSFFINENIELVGKWKTIGPTPSKATLKRTANTHFLIEKTNIAKRFKERRPDCSKQDFGSAIIFAGSYGMMGAAVLATKAACRSGCGKVSCHSPQCGYNILQITAPSALFDADYGEKHIKSIETKSNYTSVAIGPGMGTADETINALESFLKIASANHRPVILDADALNCIAIRPSMLDYLPMLSVITPHNGEFDRMFGPQPSSSARIAKALEVSIKYKIIIVLKGFYTTTIRPDGKIFYNSSGTPALATAGSGDVLTGLMAGLMAQGFKPEIASISAVFVHGMAGQLAEKEHGTYGVTAEDIADYIGKAIKEITNEKVY